jgi:hypothetical protein
MNALRLSVILFFILIFTNLLFYFFEVIISGENTGIEYTLLVFPAFLISFIVLLFNLFTKQPSRVVSIIYFLFLLSLVIYLYFVQGKFIINEGILTLNTLFFTNSTLIIDDFFRYFKLPEYLCYFLSQILIPPIYLYLLIRLSLYFEKRYC